MKQKTVIANRFLLGLITLATILIFTTPAFSKDSITVALGTRLGSLDGWNTAAMVDWTVCNQIYDSLYILDPTTFRPKPNLAVSHKMLDDYTWQIKLRKGVKFHNGESFDAHSVKFSFERVLDPERKLYNQVKWSKVIEKIDVIDDFTIQIKTKKPYVVLIENLATLDTGMVPPNYIREKGDSYFSSHPVGTGPYKFASWKQGDRVELVANENYWNGIPKIKKATFRIIPEASISTAELIAGGVDVVGRMRSEQVRTVKKSKTAKVLSVLSNRGHFIQFDSIGRAGKSPFQNIKVRQAVYHAINRPAIIKMVLEGYGKDLNGPLSSTYFGFDPSVADLEPQYNPEKAKKLLAEAGYPDGFNAQLSVYEQKSVYEAVQGFLSKVGINTKLNWYGADLSTLVQLRNSGKVKDMGAYSWGSVVYDPDYFLPYWFGMDSARNYMKDQEISDWLAEAGREFDEAKRKKLYRKVQIKIIENAFWVPVFNEKALYGVNKKLNLVALGEFPQLRSCSWQD